MLNFSVLILYPLDMVFKIIPNRRINFSFKPLILEVNSGVWKNTLAVFSSLVVPYPGLSIKIPNSSLNLSIISFFLF